jgi:exopolysaccharide biosynthesis polyprenyl glycosylphosphotransferase
MSRAREMTRHRLRLAPLPDQPGVEAIDGKTLASGHSDKASHLGRSHRPGRSWLVPRSLVVADLLGLGISYLLTALFWGHAGAFGSSKQLAVFCATLPCWLAVADVQGLYRADYERADHSSTDDIVGVFYMVTAGVWAFLVASRFVGTTTPGASALVTFWAVAICLLPLARIVARRACHQSSSYIQNTLILGAGDVGQLIARKLVNHPEYGLNVVGFVDREPRARRSALPEDLAVLGAPERLRELIDRHHVERVIIAFSREPVDELLLLLRRLRDCQVQVDLVPRFYELVGLRVTAHAVEGVPLLGLPPNPAEPFARALKRAIDAVVAAVALTVLSPVFVYIAARIRLDSEGPVFFRQTRLSANMKEFRALKFRTMRVDTDQSVHRAAVRSSSLGILGAVEEGKMYKLDRSDAVTSFGRGLRRTSLDELPQLINVLRGEMSLVGPRPCIPYEIENFQAHHFERFAVPQGITGLWQVTARANCTFLEALDMDVVYARSWSLGLDLRLLLRTPLQVLRQRRATA